MDYSKLTSENVKKAIEAQLAHDKEAFFALFTDEVIFTDHAQVMDFKPFFDNAFNHKERFLSIDKVENDGKDVYGKFDVGQWGSFDVYFKFGENAEGKFNRLDIGQVSKP